MLYRKIWSIVFLCGILILAACEKNIVEPVRVNSAAYPSTPIQLTIGIGDKLIHLKWMQKDASDIGKYNIYRRDSTMTSESWIDSTLSREYFDRDVQNGMSYFYRVTAVNKKGYEGRTSNLVSAQPGLFAINIENGALYTRNRRVTIQCIAHEDIRYLMLSQDSLFVSSRWEPFAAQLQWELSPEDGVKRVFARFATTQGVETAQIVFDEVILDTQAEIRLLQYNASNTPFKTGDTLNFIMKTGEANGSAKVVLHSSVPEIPLYDDATHGDVQANDSIYTHSFVIPMGWRVTRCRPGGYFLDHLGNSAAPWIADQELNIVNPPAPVQLFPPVTIGTRHDVLYLSWSRSADTEFANYKVFRSMDARLDSTAVLIRIIENVASSSFTDSLLQSNTRYFYRVWVTDRMGVASGSNSVEGQTPPNVPPVAVKLEAPVATASRTLFLAWTRNGDHDFASYRIFRSSASESASPPKQIAHITDRSVTTFTDTDLSDETTFNYWVSVFDREGLYSESNHVSGTTLAANLPTPVTLATPMAILAKSLRLTWSASQDRDFASYRIFRSNRAKIDSSGAPIALINTITTTTFDDFGLENNTMYYYRVYVYTTQNYCAGSNVVSGKTLP